MKIGKIYIYSQMLFLTWWSMIQVRKIAEYRDRNKDGFRTGDLFVTGDNFGVNQHWGYDMEHVDGASAGCLVVQSTDGHREFMRIVKTHSQYQNNSNYVFLTTIIPGVEILSD
jgi:hypothetical protein